MRDVMHRIRARVDRLVAGVACERHHTLMKISRVAIGEPVPDWPSANAATTCGLCGAELEYRHIVMKQLPD